MSEAEYILRQIANLVAQRGFKRDADWNETILDCVAAILAKSGYSNRVDVL